MYTYLEKKRYDTVHGWATIGGEKLDRRQDIEENLTYIRILE